MWAFRFRNYCDPVFQACFVGYGIYSHELFTFDAALAAENIVSTIPDSLVLTDIKGKMIKVNERLVSFTGYVERELIGELIKKLCAEDEQIWDRSLK